MPASVSPIPIGICGFDNTPGNARHGCGLWPAGYAAAVTAAGGEPVPLDRRTRGRSWDDVLDGLHGILRAGSDSGTKGQLGEGTGLCEWCRKRQFPLLAVDHGLHLLNATYGGSVYNDLALDLPEALQHRHPPEKGV